MWKRFRGVPVVVMVAGSLASCNTAANHAAAPVPETDQAVSSAMKELYMTASAAAPQSTEQQNVVLRMAQKASSGKELLLVARAAVGVFPAASPEPRIESQVRSIVTAKMLTLGTLNQLMEYAAEYPIDPQSARPFIERMFQLGGDQPDARVWYRIKVAAAHLKVGDLERQAQAKGDQLARK
jgi:hypothetical protein